MNQEGRGAGRAELDFRDLVDVLSSAVLLTDEGGRVVHANAAAGVLFGFDANRLIGRPLRDALPELPAGRLGTTPAPSLYVASLRDARALAVAEERQRIVAEASARLGQSLDFEETIGNVARFVVATMADGCVVDLVEPDDRVRRIAVAHADPEKQRWVERLRGLPPPPLDGTFWRTLRTNEPIVVVDLTEKSLQSLTQDEEQLEVLRALEPRSGLIVPLLARHRVIGVLWIFASEAGRYGPADASFAAELASRIALAVDHARLFTDAQQAIGLRDEFLSIAGHELNTPLTSLSLQLEAIRRGELSAGMQKKLEVADRQVVRLAKLVDQLLDVSRITAGRLHLEPSPTDLADIVRDVVESLRGEIARAWAPRSRSRSGAPKGRGTGTGSNKSFTASSPTPSSMGRGRRST